MWKGTCHKKCPSPYCELDYHINYLFLIKLKFFIFRAEIHQEQLNKRHTEQVDLLDREKAKVSLTVSCRDVDFKPELLQILILGYNFI